MHSYLGLQFIIALRLTHTYKHTPGVVKPLEVCQVYWLCSVHNLSIYASFLTCVCDRTGKAGAAEVKSPVPASFMA